MISEMFETWLAFQIAIAVGVAAVLLLRRWVRRWVGVRQAFGLWALPVVLGLAVLAPGPFEAGPDAALSEASSAQSPASVLPPPVSASEEAGPSRVQSDQAMPASRAIPALVDQRVWLGIWGLGALAAALLLVVRQARYLENLGPIQPWPELGPDVYRAGSSKIGVGLVGVVFPKIVAPADFEVRFSADERDLILDHEREHRRAGHAQLNGLAALVQTLCWMNPLVHIGLRWFRLDQELACDAATLMRSQHSPRRYGQALLRAQTGLAAPLGCAWRPVDGLKTRIQALSLTGSNTSRRALGGGAVLVLVAGFAAAGWAARPEVQAVAPGQGALAIEATDDHDAAVTQSATRIEVRGVDGRVQIIAEEREDVVVEGLSTPVPIRRGGSTMVVQVSELTTDICSRSAGTSQDFTMRVPVGVHLDIQGRMDATITAPASVSLGAQGCGSVSLGDVQGGLVLDVHGSVALTARHVNGPMTAAASGVATLRAVLVSGELDLQTSGSSTVEIETMTSGGRFDLSGGSTLQVEEWAGALHGGLSGGSRAKIEAILSSRADITVSGSSNANIETGEISDLRVDQAANAGFFYGGQAEQSRVRNRGRAPVVLTDPGRLDSQGLVSTDGDPPVE